VAALAVLIAALGPAITRISPASASTRSTGRSWQPSTSSDPSGRPRPPPGGGLSGLLVLLRHGQSQWNDQHRFTGWADPTLAATGRAEATAAARALHEAALRPHDGCHEHGRVLQHGR